MQASLAPLLMQIYGLNALQVGLTYLPYGVGCGVASYLAGKNLLTELVFYSESRYHFSFHFALPNIVAMLLPLRPLFSPSQLRHPK